MTQIGVGRAGGAVVSVVAEAGADPGEFGEQVAGEVLAQGAFWDDPVAEPRSCGD
jgi:hypothetical protein